MLWIWDAQQLFHLLDLAAAQNGENNIIMIGMISFLREALMRLGMMFIGLFFSVQEGHVDRISSLPVQPQGFVIGLFFQWEWYFLALYFSGLLCFDMFSMAWSWKSLNCKVTSSPSEKKNTRQWRFPPSICSQNVYGSFQSSVGISKVWRYRRK